jgi:hypothetical protein
MELVMRTNVVLDEAKLAELVRLAGARSKTAAAARAFDEPIRREKLRRLGVQDAGLSGADDPAVRRRLEGSRLRASRQALPLRLAAFP